jgi:hypothetical protein
VHLSSDSNQLFRVWEDADVQWIRLPFEQLNLGPANAKMWLAAVGG